MGENILEYYTRFSALANSKLLNAPTKQCIRQVFAALETIDQWNYSYLAYHRARHLICQAPQSSEVTLQLSDLCAKPQWNSDDWVTIIQRLRFVLEHPRRGKRSKHASPASSSSSPSSSAAEIQDTEMQPASLSASASASASASDELLIRVAEELKKPEDSVTVSGNVTFGQAVDVWQNHWIQQAKTNMCQAQYLQSAGLIQNSGAPNAQYWTLLVFPIRRLQIARLASIRPPTQQTAAFVTANANLSSQQPLTLDQVQSLQQLLVEQASLRNKILGSLDNLSTEMNAQCLLETSLFLPYNCGTVIQNPLDPLLGYIVFRIKMIPFDLEDVDLVTILQLHDGNAQNQVA